MRKLLIAIAVTLIAASACRNNAGSFVTGNLDIYLDFKSEFVEGRAVRVWTPSDYDPSKKYDVIYMHDGQNLFDASITWNQQEWGVDEVISSLIESGDIRPCIVVGIDNSELRYAEYYPSAICDDVPAGVLPDAFKSWGDEYLRFVVEEVKPWIDGKYSTWPDAAHTFIMGSSCGGLISSYALCEYPDVFGGAACLSTHSSLMNPDTEVDQKPASETYINYLRENLPADENHLLDMDCGDCQIDMEYFESQALINETIAALNWDGNYMYRFFPGQSHSENDWRSRLDIPVRFLLGVK